MKWEISDKVANWIFAVILAITTYFCFYRLGYYSLWGDETWVATSALSSIYEIFTFVDLPGNPFFILLIKGFISIFGTSEFAFRFIPALFYALSVLVFYLLLKIITNKNYIVTLIATALFAFNPTLIWFSHELKQYTFEIFFTLFLFYLAERYVAEKTNRNFWILTISSILSVLFSFPSVFVIPAVVLRLALNEYSKGDGIFSNHYLTKIKKIVIYTVLTAGTFLIYYFSILHQRAEEGKLIMYWTNFQECMPASSDFKSVFDFVASSSFSFFKYVFYYSGFESIHYKILGCLFIIGALYVLFYEKRIKLLNYALIPFALTIAASIVGKYPYCGSRVNLYLLPFIFVFIAYAFYCLVLIFRIDKRISRLIIMIFLVVGSAYIIVEYGPETLSLDQIRMNNLTSYYLDNVLNDSDYTYINTFWYMYPGYLEDGPLQKNLSKFKLERITNNPLILYINPFNESLAGLTLKERFDIESKKIEKGRRVWIISEILDREDKIKKYLFIRKELDRSCVLEDSKKDFGVILDLYQC